MKIQYFKEYNCYIIKADDDSVYLINFSNNRILKATYSFENLIAKIPDDIIAYLCDEGIISKKEQDFYPQGIYKPVSVTFLMTSRCNLNCIYCYAYNNCDKDLSFASAQSVIDYLVDNAIFRGIEEITVRFHGLGEPTQNFDVLKQIVEYTKSVCAKRPLRANFNITTNGVMNDEQRDFIQKNINYITLSMDGTKYYQNNQRPLSGGDSFDEALKTLYGVQDKDKLLIRTTVTNFNLKNLEEWCNFLQQIGVKNINVEPVSVCGNCQNNNIDDLDINFYQTYMKLCDRFPHLKITYSCFRHSNSPYHCGAFGGNMVVTPFGDISTCYECFDLKERSQSLFIIGKIVNDEVLIDNNKFNTLKDVCTMLRKECSNCFAQSFCNGSCLSKRYKSSIEDKNSYTIVGNKCIITKRIVFEKLNARLCSEISCVHSEKLF